MSANILSQKNKVLVEQAKKISGKFSVAVVSPTTTEGLCGALNAAEEGIIEPILIGPVSKMSAAAEQIGADIKKYQCIDISNAFMAAQKATELAREKRVGAIMKGDIHTAEIMKAVLAKESGLRTERRVSHCLVMDVPAYEKITIFTDVAINIAPDLTSKKDIIQNAIYFAHAIGISTPNVAILSAIEDVTEGIQATLDAAILCKMADRGQIVGGNLDGPLSIDLAISEEAIRLKRFKRILPGLPDIFMVPDLNAGNIAIKILDYMANGQSAGIVVGTKVPVVMMRRSSPAVEHIVSCALAKIYQNYLEKM